MNTSETKIPWITRILLCLVGAAVLVACVVLFASLITHGFHWRPIFYLGILLSPFLYCLWWRGAMMWREGFLAPRKDRFRLRFNPRPECTRFYGWTLLVFLSFATLLYSLELWRGKRAYARLQREVEAKGGSLAFSAVLPPPVPDDQNFCATPLLAAMMDYKTSPPFFGPMKFEWRNPAIIDRLKAMSLPTPKQGQQGWFCAEMTDLAAWQEAFANNTNYPASVTSRGPAEAVLQALSQFDPELNELRAANQRPGARWALHYQDGFFVQRGDAARREALDNLVNILTLRAAAELATGRTDAALQDVKLSLRLADSLQPEPLFLPHQQRKKLLLTSLQAVWEGLVTHRWTESQLAELQARLSQFDPSSEWRTALRGDTYLWMEQFRQIHELFSLKTLRTQLVRSNPRKTEDLFGEALFILWWVGYPTGWYYQNQVYIYRLYERGMTAGPLFAQPHTPSAGKEDRLEKPEDPLLAILMLPKLREMFGDARNLDYVTSIEEARLACALERYRLAHGEYPATLEALTPRFVDALPPTASARQPLLDYRRTTPGQFLLYPAGMTNVSETWQKSNSQGNNYFGLGRPLGDIDGVWRFPAK